MNVTEICGPTTTIPNIINTVSANVTVPALVILFISIFLSLLVIGLIMVKQSRAKFMGIYFLTLVINLIVLTSLILLPNTVYNLWQYLKTALG